MFKIVFTLDYEIYGNGKGDPCDLMVSPTRRLLDLFDHYGAKLTIMADFAEIIKFKEYLSTYKRDDYSYHAILDQLRNAVSTGHDVQLHVHSSYLKAKFEEGRWVQNWSEYNLAELSYERIEEIIRTGKNFLENLLRPVKPSYECFAFRAANWSMNPSVNIVKALVANDIKIDTSIFKYGHRSGLVNFDYTNAFSALIPWLVSESDICQRDAQGKLFEFPIYCERQPISKFITIFRLWRMLQEIRYSVKGAENEKVVYHDPAKKTFLSKYLSSLFQKHAWKMDFNQCTGRQLIEGLKRAEVKYADFSCDLPFVLIGHSKLYTRRNEKNLKIFLDFIAQHSQKYTFSTFDKFDLAIY